MARPRYLVPLVALAVSVATAAVVATTTHANAPTRATLAYSGVSPYPSVQAQLQQQASTTFLQHRPGWLYYCSLGRLDYVWRLRQMPKFSDESTFLDGIGAPCEFLIVRHGKPVRLVAVNAAKAAWTTAGGRVVGYDGNFIYSDVPLKIVRVADFGQILTNDPSAIHS